MVQVGISEQCSDQLMHLPHIMLTLAYDRPMLVTCEQLDPDQRIHRLMKINIFLQKPTCTFSQERSHVMYIYERLYL